MPPKPFYSQEQQVNYRLTFLYIKISSSMNKINLVLSVLFSFSSFVQSQTGWVQQTSGTSSQLWSVFFVNSSTGWATGFNGTILNTVNGGTNWTPHSSGTTEHLFSVYFAIL